MRPAQCKYRLFSKIATCFTLLFVLGNAHAILNLKLTKGVDSAVPIAIVPFGGDVSSMDPAQVISTDLTNSGQFRPIATSSMRQQPHFEREVRYSDWKSVGVNNIVIGNVKAISGGRYQVTFFLLDVYGGAQAVLSSKSFTVDQSQLRNLSHHISDLVYQGLTGDRGIFSTRIAYVQLQSKNNRPEKYILEVADYDGHNPQPLLTSDFPLMSPAWSPDGKKIAYVSFQNRRAAIYVIDVATGRQTRVSDYQGINGAPAWSPDGKSLAMVLSKGGSPKIYLKNLSSGTLKQLTRGSSIDTEPNFAPDGRSLLFTSNRGGSPQLYRVVLSSGKISRLTFDGGYNASGEFTPDGKDIVLLHRNKGVFNIAEQVLTSGRLTVLTTQGFASSPSVAPNGRMVIYGTYRGGKQILAMVSTDGKVMLDLPLRNGSVQEPAWSPYL